MVGYPIEQQRGIKLCGYDQLSLVCPLSCLYYNVNHNNKVVMFCRQGSKTQQYKMAFKVNICYFELPSDILRQQTDTHIAVKLAPFGSHIC